MKLDVNATPVRVVASAQTPTVLTNSPSVPSASVKPAKEKVSVKPAQANAVAGQVAGGVQIGVVEGPQGTTFTPNVSNDGVISWTNDGGKDNPRPVNVKGPKGDKGATGASGQDGFSPVASVSKSGTVATISITDKNGTTTATVTDGQDGQDGQDGAAGGFGTPTITVGANTGTPSATITASGPDTAKVFAFAFDGLKGETGHSGIPTGGTTGQVLKKKTGTDYDTEWAAVVELYPTGGGSSPSTDVQYGSIGSSTYAARFDHRHPTKFPTTGTPANLGTASNGSADTYARSDHVHNSVTMSFTVTLAAASWSSNTLTVSNANFYASGYAYMVAPASTSFAEYTEASIYADDVTTDGEMTFNCDTAPSSDLTVNIVRAVA